jgi:hypothetical protein
VYSRRERREIFFGHGLHPREIGYAFHRASRSHGLGIKLKDQKMNFTAENAEKNCFIVEGTDKKDI